MPQKLKSAPPRIATKRTSAIKDIEIWIQKGNEFNLAHDQQRVAGRLTDNVTEERLLHAKLLELGKERYKFLVHSTYEKQMFLEKQKKKEGFIKSYLTHAHLSRRKSTIKNDSETVRNVDSDQQKNDSNDTKEKYESQEPTKEIGFTSNELTAGVHIQTGKRYAHSPVSKQKEETRLVLTLHEGHDGVKSWAKRDLPNSGRRKRSNDLTKDPRYVRFEKSLCPAYLPDHKIDVKTIIQNIGSLHMPPKIPKDGRGRIGEKLHIFMKERGIVF